LKLFSGRRTGNRRRNCTHPLISRTASLPLASCLVPSFSLRAPSAVAQNSYPSGGWRTAVAAPAPTASTWRLTTMAPLPSGKGRRGKNGRRCAAEDEALSGGGASWCAAQCGPPDRNLTARNGNGESGFAHTSAPTPTPVSRLYLF
jgi:hypothetical protein